MRIVGAVVLAALPAVATGQAPDRADAGRLSLQRAATLAMTVHPALGAARAAHDDAVAAVRESRAPLWPRLSIDASLTQFQEPMLVAPLHAFDPTALPSFDRSLVRGNLALGYTLFDGGARLRRIRGASSQASASEAAMQAVAQDLLADVAVAYLRVLSESGVLEATARRLAALRAERDRAARVFAEGRAPRVDLLRVEAQLERGRADSVAVALDLDVAEHDLARITGLDVASTRAARLLAYRLPAGVAAEPAETLLTRALAANPEVERARRATLAAEAASGVARAAWLPELRLGAAYNGYGGLSSDFSAEWQAGVMVSYPIFEGGARSQAVARADARELAAREEERLAELRARGAVDRADAAWRSARARVDALNRAVTQSEEVVRIERLALDAGAGIQTDYLLAEAELFAVRASLVEARHVEIGAWIALARATGELTLDWLSDSLEVEP